MVDAEPNAQPYGANEHTPKDQIKQEDSLHIDNNDLLHRYFQLLVGGGIFVGDFDAQSHELVLSINLLIEHDIIG